MKHTVVTLALVALASAPLIAQPALTVPDVSPEASVSQQVGLTQVSVSYHRPAVNGREIWGGLVPFDQVWRAGANENTVITVSTDVTFNGQPLAAGTYGLHLVPAESGDWTVAVSNTSSAWGSFSYDESEDALRVQATPETAPHRERLLYTFDDPQDDSVVLTLHWETVRLPVTVEVDLSETIMDSVRAEMRGLPRFFWQGWNQAAALAVQYGGDLDEAMAWVDRSITMNRNFTNLTTKANLLEANGDASGANEIRVASMDIATEAELNNYGYQLYLGQGRVDDALEIFAENVRRHPESWNVYDSLGEAQAAKGLTEEAVANYSKALEMTEDDTQKERIRGVLEQLQAD